MKVFGVVRGEVVLKELDLDGYVVLNSENFFEIDFFVVSFGIVFLDYFWGFWVLVYFISIVKVGVKSLL